MINEPLASFLLAAVLDRVGVPSPGSSLPRGCITGLHPGGREEEKRNRVSLSVPSFILM